MREAGERQMWKMVGLERWERESVVNQWEMI
jgi:hypothetical protein